MKVNCAGYKILGCFCFQHFASSDCLLASTVSKDNPIVVLWCVMKNFAADSLETSSVMTRVMATIFVTCLGMDRAGVCWPNCMHMSMGLYNQIWEIFSDYFLTKIVVPFAEISKVLIILLVLFACCFSA